MAVDGSGDVFIADSGNNRVVEVKADGTQTTVGSGLTGPAGVAVDRSGDVFIADYANDRVVEVKAGVPMVVAPATLTVTANDASRAYESADPAFTDTITGFVNGQSASVVSGSPVLSTTAMLASPPGQYPITVGPGTLNAANYTFTLVNGSLTVAAAPLVTLSQVKDVLNKKHLVTKSSSRSAVPSTRQRPTKSQSTTWPSRASAVRSPPRMLAGSTWCRPSTMQPPTR